MQLVFLHSPILTLFDVSDKYLLEAIESKHVTQAVSVLSLKAFLACAFRDFEEGAQVSFVVSFDNSFPLYFLPHPFKWYPVLRRNSFTW